MTARSESLPITIPTFDDITCFFVTVLALANLTSFEKLTPPVKYILGLTGQAEFQCSGCRARHEQDGMESILFNIFRQDLQDEQDFSLFGSLSGRK
jgi:hypothetical protein